MTYLLAFVFGAVLSVILVALVFFMLLKTPSLEHLFLGWAGSITGFTLQSIVCILIGGVG